MPTPSHLAYNATVLDTAALLAEIRGCRLCDGLPLGPKPIVQFSASARVLIVGQAPGRITHHKGVPFDDPSGKRLRDWLGVDRAAFYDPERFAIVPMGFCFPGTGRGGDLPPRTECAPTWRARITEALPNIDLTLYVGRYAIDWHMPAARRLSVADAVRASLELWPKAVALPHPSPRNNRWLRVNDWFEGEVVPMVRERVKIHA